MEPENTEWQQTEVGGRIDKSAALLLVGRIAESQTMLESASALLERMLATDPSNTDWSKLLRLKQMVVAARLAVAKENALEAKALIDEAIGLSSDDKGSVNCATVLLLAGDIEAALNTPKSARAYWLGALETMPDIASLDDERFRLAKRLGQSDDARKLQAKLDRRGFRHPAYLSEK